MMGVVYCGKDERMYRILVVEDELNIRKIIKDYLKRAGMDVVGAEDGEIDLFLSSSMFYYEDCRIVDEILSIPVYLLAKKCVANYDIENVLALDYLNIITENYMGDYKNATLNKVYSTTEAEALSSKIEMDTAAYLALEGRADRVQNNEFAKQF